MLMWWFWATAGDKNEGYLGGSVKTQGEDGDKAGTWDDIMLLLKRRIVAESRGQPPMLTVQHWAEDHSLSYWTLGTTSRT